MGSNGSLPASTRSHGTAEWLGSLLEGERGEALRAQLAAKHPRQSADEIEDAIHTACALFLEDAQDLDGDGGQAYAWVRTVAHRVLARDFERHRRELAVDPSTSTFQTVASNVDDPAERLAGLEMESDLTELTRDLAQHLSDPQRQVLALYGAGHTRQEIADRLGRTHRAVKRDLLEIMEQARSSLARLAGGGCELGEPLVVRLACGLASPGESSQARLHLSRCRRCGEFHERLNLWRENVAALLPVPAVDEAGPGVLDRVVHKTLDGVSSLKQHLADGAAQAKQHAGAAYVRATDPLPLAGARPGAALAVVAGCVTIGTGTYCVQNDVNPLRDIGIFPPAVEAEPPPKTPERVEVKRPTRQPRVETVPQAVEPAQQPAPAPAPAPEPEPEPQPSAPTPAPPSGGDSLSGLSGNPEPAPAPAPPATSGSGGGTTFGGL